MTITADVLIIGGGPAGLATALALSRKLHSVLLFDSQEYRNRQTSYMHNVLGFDVSQTFLLAYLVCNMLITTHHR